MILSKIQEDPQSGSCLNISYSDMTGIKLVLFITCMINSVRIPNQIAFCQFGKQMKTFITLTILFAMLNSCIKITLGIIILKSCTRTCGQLQPHRIALCQRISGFTTNQSFHKTCLIIFASTA